MIDAGVSLVYGSQLAYGFMWYLLHEGYIDTMCHVSEEEYL